MCRPAVCASLQAARTIVCQQGLSPSGSRASPPPKRSFSTRRLEGCSPRGVSLYQQALELAREEHYDAARAAFQDCLNACPALTKAWVSWAQMEKRVCRTAGETGPQRFNRCRAVLQRAMTANPTSAELTQAWGLMELQKGNAVAAVKLLERSVKQDPRNLPVLRWQPVRQAQESVRGMKSRRASL